MIKKKCRVCGKLISIKPFHAKKGWGKYCSIKCHAKAQIKGKWVECDQCGKRVWRTPKDFKRSKNNRPIGKRECQVTKGCRDQFKENGGGDSFESGNGGCDS